uniref:Uncharacterized protein n=1 Tax=Physcomitrium patens TaxID=3218 RepID=A0A2K1JTR4_PHYPA|nr:hypothetical protein PHYPA_014691 [Physcomitrium patens]
MLRAIGNHYLHNILTLHDSCCPNRVTLLSAEHSNLARLQHWFHQYSRLLPFLQFLHIRNPEITIRHWFACLIRL